jgi:hypothetical protein
MGHQIPPVMAAESMVYLYGSDFCLYGSDQVIAIRYGRDCCLTAPP